VSPTAVPLAWTDHRVFPAADDGALLFDAERASLFAIDAPTHAALSRWRDTETIALDAVPPDEHAALAALAGIGVLAPARARASPPLLPDPAAIPLGTLVLEAAQACNLRCTYCYAGGGTYGGPARAMPPALAARAARQLVEASGKRESVTLVLFGGEPLINLPALQAAVEAGEVAARERGKRLVVSMTTNGTRFSDAALDFIAAHGIGVSVSIDGPPDIHDANRPHAGGAGSHADVLAGLARFVARTGRRPAARVTLVPAQFARIEEVFDHVRALGFLEVGIAPVSPVDIDHVPRDGEEDTLLAGFEALADRFVAEAAQGRVLPFSNLLDLLAKLHTGDVRHVPCGAGLGYAAMDAGGEFYLCHRFVGNAAFRIGDAGRGIDATLVRACLDDQKRSQPAECGTCWTRSLCAGGCHYDNHQRAAVLGLPAGGSCIFIRRWIEAGIRTYAGVCASADAAVLDFLAHRARH
jgi:uncharacterized protein